MSFQTNYEVDFSARDPLPSVDAMFHRRWSPRSFCKTDIPQDTLATLFEAARWAPSCYNDQPWVFITSTSEADFHRFLNLLVEGNQAWAANASVLGFVCARRYFTHNDEQNPWANFDCGAAWMSLLMQASLLGLYMHGMAGIKKDQIYKELDIPKDRFEVISGFALGVIDTADKLPEAIAARERPSPRKPLDEVWLRGSGGKLR